MLAGLLVMLLLPALPAGEAVDPDARALAAWLSRSPAQRESTRVACIDQAKAAGATVFATVLAAAASPDPVAITTLDALTPRDARVACWCGIQAARLYVRQQRAAEAITQLLALRDAAPDLRLRYEAVLALHDALRAAKRDGEAEAVRRELTELATHELYAETGLEVPTAGPEVVDQGRRVFEAAAKAHADGQLAQAIAGYQQVIKAYPNSSWAARSRLGLGWIEVQQRKIERGEAIWQALAADKPEAAWRGQALLALVDVAILERLDPQLATARLVPLTQRLAAHAPGADDSWDSIRMPALQYQVILALAAGQSDRAAALANGLIQGDPAHGSVRSSEPGEATFRPASGLGRLLERIASREPLTPPAALSERHPKANMLLLLGDAWMAAERQDRATALFERLYQPDFPAAAVQRLYARMRLADLAWEAGNISGFRLGYTACLDEQPRNPWAAWQQICLAVDAYTKRQAEPEALKRLAQVVRDFPDSGSAQNALWYQGLIALWAGRWSEADKAWRDLDARYPEHPWREVIATTYRPWLTDVIAKRLRPDQIAPPQFSHPVEARP